MKKKPRKLKWSKLHEKTYDNNFLLYLKHREALYSNIELHIRENLESADHFCLAADIKSVASPTNDPSKRSRYR